MNNELKLTVDEQQNDIKPLKDLCDINHENDVQEITAAINAMKKKPVCGTCNQTYETTNWFKYIFRKSTLSSDEIIVANVQK